MEDEKGTTHELQKSNLFLDLLPNLPQEIIIDILSRLPVKSLLRFRCVSKSWLSLISSSQFIQIHFNTSARNKKYAHYGLILGSLTVPIKLYTCPLDSILLENSPVNATELDCPWQRPYGMIGVVGSCNGLLCVSIRRTNLILWNPSTRKCKELPHTGTVLKFNSYITYGIGYDESCDDYKVVEISGAPDNDGVICEAEVKIYSLRTNSWRKIHDYKGDFSACNSGAFVNGSIHWPATRTENSAISWIFVSLNMASETFEEIPQPNYENANCIWRLEVLNGYLSVFCSYHEVRMEVWVMKEYGVGESWTKLVSIPYHILCEYVSPLLWLENGEILLNCGYRLVLYNAKDNTIKHRHIQILGAYLEGEAGIYVESLVSPHSTNVAVKANPEG